MNIRQKLIAPFRFNKATKGMNNKEKAIVIIYFPSLILMWYFYYAWKNNESFVLNAKGEQDE